MKEYQITKIIFLIGSLFFFFESFLHFFGLDFLEHNVIFIPTHDRYIALFALTYSTLLLLISTDIKKYNNLIKIVLIGIFLSIVNATYIAFTGGYSKYFSVLNLDDNLRLLGLGVYVWYFLTLIFYYYKK